MDQLATLVSLGTDTRLDLIEPDWFCRVSVTASNFVEWCVVRFVNLKAPSALTGGTRVAAAVPDTHLVVDLRGLFLGVVVKQASNCCPASPDAIPEATKTFFFLTGVVLVLEMTIAPAAVVAVPGVALDGATPDAVHADLSAPQVSFTGPMPRARVPTGVTALPSHFSPVRLGLPFHAAGEPDFDIAMMKGSPLVK